MCVRDVKKEVGGGEGWRDIQRETVAIVCVRERDRESVSVREMARVECTLCARVCVCA